jgi:IclR family acetate operon transcriptional repressor
LFPPQSIPPKGFWLRWQAVGPLAACGALAAEQPASGRANWPAVPLPGPGERLPALTANTVGTHAALARELEETRQRGYSIEREQNVLGLGCVGVTVPYRIPATDAISCSIPIARCTDKEVQRVAAIIRDHVQRLATLLRSEGIR